MTHHGVGWAIASPSARARPRSVHGDDVRCVRQLRQRCLRAAATPDRAAKSYSTRTPSDRGVVCRLGSQTRANLTVSHRTPVQFSGPEARHHTRSAVAYQRRVTVLAIDSGLSSPTSMTCLSSTSISPKPSQSLVIASEWPSDRRCGWQHGRCTSRAVVSGPHRTPRAHAP